MSRTTVYSARNASITLVRAARAAGHSDAPIAATNRTAPAANTVIAPGIWTCSTYPAATRASANPATRPKRDAGRRDQRTGAQHTDQDVLWHRAERHQNAELTRPAADRERQHATDPDDGNHQGHRREEAEHRRVQAVWRQHLGSNILERRRLFHRLIRGELANDPRQLRHQRVGIGSRVHEDPPAGELLFERLIHGHHRFRHDVLVVDIGHHADNATRLATDVDELDDRIGPEQRAVEDIATGKQAGRDAFGDDHHRLTPVPIVEREIASGTKRNAQGGEISG